MPTIQYYANRATEALSHALGFKKKQPATNKVLLLSGAALAIAAIGYGVKLGYSPKIAHNIHPIPIINTPLVPVDVPPVSLPPSTPPFWNKVVDFCSAPLFSLGAVVSAAASWGIWTMLHPVRPLAAAAAAPAAAMAQAAVAAAAPAATAALYAAKYGYYY